ncbi:transposase (plasmid) [Nostoc sp. UHCC 0302]|uniref:transposase n=1 Tax=Nostoc sp. UHCC 0302 TaxID=3134896 RepID=UPI00311CA8B7
MSKIYHFSPFTQQRRPEDQTCVLRSYIRQRDTLIKSASVHVQRMQKALIQMNVHLHKVISDVTGLTGMKIIKAIVAGEQDPQVLASLKDPRIKSSTADISKALTGDYLCEHLFVLQQELTLYEVYQQQITAVDAQIEKCLASFEPKTLLQPPTTGRKRRKKPTANHPTFDLHNYLYRMAGVDFTLINGLDALTVRTILSEVGLDPKRFPTVKHFTSWLGLCPGQKVTGGQVKSSKTRTVVNRAANAFRMAAFSLTQSRSAVGAFYRRLRSPLAGLCPSRLGTPKAITATAHKLARMFYLIFRTST